MINPELRSISCNSGTPELPPDNQPVEMDSLFKL